jgi:hypothetical protein
LSCSEFLQVGSKHPRSATTQATEQQAKMAKLQPDASQQLQQTQQAGAMPSGTQALISNDSTMKVAQDAHREYRKAGELVQTAHQLLCIVSGQVQQDSLSPQAIAHLTQAKWTDSVTKAVTDYKHTERSLHRAVKVLKVRTNN